MHNALIWGAFALALACGFDCLVTGVIAHTAADLINHVTAVIP
jgi:hypothetical protein